MPEQYSGWTFRNRDAGEIKEALELSQRLGELGFPTLPDEEIHQMEQELKTRGILYEYEENDVPLHTKRKS